MKNKGFTLVEVLAVIVLIGLLTILISVPVNKFIKDSNQKAYERQIDQIILAANSWTVENPYLLPPYIEEESVQLTIEDLKNEGFLDNDIVDPRNKQVIPSCSYVEIVLNVDAMDSEKNIYKYNFFELENC